MTHLRPVVFSIAMVSLGWAVASPSARADGVQEAVYNDAKDLIEDLITGELAKSTVELFVCASPDKLSYYFPETLQSLHKEQLSNLGLLVRKESAAAVGEWVRRASRGEAKTSLKEMFAGLGLPSGVSMDGWSHDHFSKLAQACAKNFGALSPDASLKSPEAIPLKGQASKPPVADNAVTAKLAETLLAMMNAKTAERPLGSCGKPYKGVPEAFACELGLAAQALLLQQDGVASDHLVGASLAVLIQSVGKKGASIQADGAVNAEGPAPPQSAVSTFYAQWLKLKDIVSQAMGPGEGHPSLPRVKQMLSDQGLADFASNEPLFETVFFALRQMSVQGLSASSVVQGIGAVLDLAPTGEPNMAVEQIKATVTSVEFMALIQSLKSGDGQRIAFDAIDTALFAAEHAGSDSKQKAATKAVIAVLRYAGETRDGKGPSAGTREAAKAALFDYMSATGRSGYSHSVVGGEWLTVSLGASFSPGYVNSGPQGVRFPASAQLLTLKLGLRSTAWSYFGVHLAALDALRPVGELVLRDQKGEFSNSGRVWANFFHPRMDLVVGIPALTRRLALFAGFGFVPVAPVKTGESKYEYEWINLRQRDRPASVKTAGDFVPRFLDFEIGIRYYPF